MQQFVWEGKDSKGRELKGENEAPNAAYVKSMLRRQGIRDLGQRGQDESLSPCFR